MSIPAKVLAALLLAAALACGGGGSTVQPQPPRITSFGATQTLVTAGASSSLSGQFTGGTGTVDHGVGAVTAGVPVATGALDATTTFTLTVAGSGGQDATATATVNVVPTPVITSFTNNGPIALGAPAQLTAVFAGGTGIVTPGPLAITSGVPLVTNALPGPTTFTLTVTNAAGSSVTATTTVTQEPSVSVLDLTLAGAPTGASVRIAGPNGYKGTITASTTLTGLAAGVYALDPAGVWSAGQVYQAAGAGTITLGQGATGSATLTYAPVTALALQVPDTTTPGSAVELDLVTIPAGAFLMGAYAGEQDSVLEEVPQHPVTLSQSFYMGEFPVTQALWRAVMGQNPAYFSVAGGGSTTDDLSRPVEFVSWNDITTPTTGFLDVLNAATAATRPAGLTFRLPTEAEWEYACRAGTVTRFYWGDDLDDTVLDLYAWWSGDSGATTHPVGALGPAAANPFGLKDMNGNVFVWCQDWFGPYLAGAQTDPTGPPAGTYRVVRGGDWYQGAAYCRSANRSLSGPSDVNSEIGLRVVLAP